ncbi:MAG: AAA family ATPase [Deltaproteobacteria bacterium]|nr:AAA family ATPase [Deltaproteobacteria bacterium]
MENDSFITRLIIRSFKSIVNQEIELGFVNVFIGANGSGKSNVLEALGVLSAAASGRVDDESLQRRGVRPGVPRLYKSSFPERLNPHIYFEAISKSARFSVSLNNPLKNRRPAWQYKTEELRSGNEKVASRGLRTAKNSEQGIAALSVVEMDESDPAVQLMNILRDYAIYAPNTMMLRGLTSDPQTREPVGLAGGRLAEAVGELKTLARGTDFMNDGLEDVLEMIDWIDGFDTTGSVQTILSSSVARPKQALRFYDRFMRTGKNILTAYDASEGALYVVFCAVLALLPNAPKCLAVDNLDQALNPRLAQRLVSSLCKWITTNPWPRQLLFTAHNPAVLDGLPLQDPKVKLFAVDRNSEGHTIVKSIVVTDNLRRLNEKKGWPLSRLWVMGHLGGVPNV